MKNKLIPILLIITIFFLQGFKLKKLAPIKEVVKIQTSFKGAKVHHQDLINGCEKKDCIPALNSPRFVQSKTVEWIASSDIVFVLKYKKTNKIYPQKILNWHEIVNETETRFGVSGKLHNSDLVMYEKLEGNLWQQLTGEAKY